ncbi:MAG: phosphoenolpyruvate carboxylase [bacterium]|nr:phosphoenolpyruvate carboxylase [bacterium]
MYRKISPVMASQHPDNAGKPYWHDGIFIGNQHETEECFRIFSEMGVYEYKWDWEGKFVDESIIERLVSEHFEYFKKNPLGKKRFLTFRLPNPKVETEFRVGRALMGIALSASLMKEIGIYSPPLFEVILPMTESADEMIDIQEAFKELTSLKHKLYRLEKQTIKHIEIIPLFEQVGTIIRSTHILREYINKHQKIFGFKPKYIRPYVARSDPALNSGIVPTVIAIKIALSRYKDFEKETGIKLYPIIGSASLPFRGGLTPFSIKQFCNEYKGIRTVLLQSAFRYDYEKNDVITAIKELKSILPHQKAMHFTQNEVIELARIIRPFEHYYKITIEEIAPIINKIASYLPKRRERVQHIGLFGYSRGVGKVKLPRAIGFTAALYSIGIPPELIGTGRGLREAQKNLSLKLIEKTYVNIRKDLIRSGKFLNKNILNHLVKENKSWHGIVDDVKAIEEYLGEKLQPVTKEEKEHHILTERIYSHLESSLSLTDLINQTALLRKSLG